MVTDLTIPAASGSLAALNAQVLLQPADHDTLMFQVSGTFVGTIVVEVSMDNTTWVALAGPQVLQNVGTQSGQSAVTTVGIYSAGISAANYVRIRASAWTSGTAVITANTVDGPSMIALDAPLPAGANLLGIVNTLPGVASAYKAISTAATIAAVVKASAGNLHELTVENYTATACYVKLYDKASAPLPASDIPVLTLYVAPGTTTIPVEYAREFGVTGKRFATGIALGATAAAGNTDTTVLAAGVQISATYS